MAGHGALTAAVALAAALVSAPAQETPASPSAATSLREALLLIARRADPAAELGPVRAQLDVWEIELRERMAAVPDARARARLVADFFFAEPLLAAGRNLADPALLHVHHVLAGREGHCLSLSAIVLAVGERLRLPLHGVASPRHFFLRWDDGKVRLNIETTERGAARDDDFYRSQGITPAAEKEGLWLRNLDRKEVIAHLLNNEGYVLWSRGEAEPARENFQAALALHPRLLEARLNLGIALATAGDEDGAREHFAHVLRFMPADAPTWFNRSLAALRAGDTPEALEAMEKAVGLDPGSPHLVQGREAVLAAVLGPGRWEGHQRTLGDRALAFRKAGRLRAGLLGSYFDNPRLNGVPVERVDRDLRFEWRYEPPHPRLPADRISIRWDGWLELPAGGVHTFSTVVNDGVRVWIDGVRIIDDWKENEGALDQESLTLVAGMHSVRIEYFEAERFAGITFQVQRRGDSRPLPPTCYHHVR